MEPITYQMCHIYKVCKNAGQNYLNGIQYPPTLTGIILQVYDKYRPTITIQACNALLQIRSCNQRVYSQDMKAEAYSQFVPVFTQTRSLHKPIEAYQAYTLAFKQRASVKLGDWQTL